MIISNNQSIIENHIKVKEIPCILLTPKNEKEIFPAIILYHGWSSSKENQRFRGSILANLGYQVIIPDSIYHGERNQRDMAIDYNDKNNIVNYFWEIVLNNIEEADDIIDTVVKKYKGDPDNIAVTGHSMGGFSSAGIFTHNKKVKTGIPLNGSFNWKECNEVFSETLESPTMSKEDERVKKLDPMNNFEKLVDRPILMLNGDADQVVPAEPQKIFYEKIKNLYEDKSNIKIISYHNLGHFVTTNMMEDLVKWLNLHLR